MNKMEFNGNGMATEGVRIAFNRLCEDLERIGKKDASHWNLGIGAGASLIAEAEQVLNDAKSFLSQMKGYVGNRK